MPNDRKTRTSRLWVLLVAALALTGTFQMPIAQRYYISDIPGLGWTGDFLLNNQAHYLLAAVFLAWVSYQAVVFLFGRRGRALTPLGWARVAAIVVLVPTGLVRALKNRADVFFSPLTVGAVDWAHLFAAMLLGIFALLALVRGVSAYQKRL